MDRDAGLVHDGDQAKVSRQGSKFAEHGLDAPAQNFVQPGRASREARAAAQHAAEQPSLRFGAGFRRREIRQGADLCFEETRDGGFSFGGFGSDSPDRAVLTAKAVERGIAASDGALAAGDFIAIGDTPRDVDAGHKTGIRVIGVATGHFSEKELTDSGADWVLATVENDFPV